MFSIAEWTDRASALSYPKKLTSSASFSPSIRISLRLKIHQAQAKNFCRVLDIRVAEVVIANRAETVFQEHFAENSCHIVRGHKMTHIVHADVVFILFAVAAAAKFYLLLLALLGFQQSLFNCGNQR